MPKNSTFFHYKHKLFSELLVWDYDKVKELMYFIASKRKNLIFSSEINNDESDQYFYKNFNTIDFPIPREPPVIIAILSFKSFIISLIFFS